MCCKCNSFFLVIRSISLEAIFIIPWHNVSLCFCLQIVILITSPSSLTMFIKQLIAKLSPKFYRKQTPFLMPPYSVIFKRWVSPHYFFFSSLVQHLYTAYLSYLFVPECGTCSQIHSLETRCLLLSISETWELAIPDILTVYLHLWSVSLPKCSSHQKELVCLPAFAWSFRLQPIPTLKRMNYVVKSDVWTLIIPEIVPST